MTSLDVKRKFDSNIKVSIKLRIGNRVSHVWLLWKKIVKAQIPFVNHIGLSKFTRFFFFFSVTSLSPWLPILGYPVNVYVDMYLKGKASLRRIMGKILGILKLLSYFINLNALSKYLFFKIISVI